MHLDKAKHSDSGIIRKITKECSLCHKVGPCSFTGMTQTGKPVYRTYCDLCRRKKEKLFRKARRKSITEQARLRKIAIKKKCIEYLGGECYHCGNRSINVLTFHHRDPEKKEHTISQIKDWSWEKIRKELDKCDMLCFNCHMEEHARWDNAKM